jgi:hypothetical protein
MFKKRDGARKGENEWKQVPPCVLPFAYASAAPMAVM